MLRRTSLSARGLPGPKGAHWIISDDNVSNRCFCSSLEPALHDSAKDETKNVLNKKET